jgi:aarF domain-containing kinase
MKTFTSLSYAGTMAYQVQTAWKQLSRLKHSKLVSAPVVSRVACALTLAAQRYHAIPYIFAFAAGGTALATRAHADADYSFPPSNSLYMHAQESRVYLTNFVISIAELLILLIRSVYLALLFTPSVVMAPFAERFDGQFRQTWLHVVRRTLEKAGPAFIKWGQWAATRPDLFPADLCSELSKLHSKAPAHSFAYTKRTVEKSFGRKISDIFDEFEEEPVASGSVAQVHRARLKNAKHPVAVKVRHPGVGEAIRRDFNIINAVAKISNCIPTLRWLRLDESVQQFAVFMMSQVDLAREAAHLSRFIYNFRRWKDVSFPKPVYPLVHPAVLVETYEHGESVSRYVDELEGHDRLKSALAHIGTHALLKMLLVITLETFIDISLY